MPSDAHIGDFVNKDDVWSFINLIAKKDSENNYPFSTDEYRNIFRHSLWIVPGVKEAKALKALLKDDKSPFHDFDVVNVAGDGDEDEKSEKALKKVKNAIENAGDDGYTITLSCGKLTTGVTVKEWTAVFMLAGSFSTSASSYLQTIFRVQSPCNINGKIKDNCYVFDFAPDRTLKMVAESVAISTKAGKADESDRAIMGAFLNYCPVISISGTQMREYSTDKLLQQLKRAYAERAVKNGFDDNNLYNDELLKLDNIELDEFKKLKGIIGSTKAQKKTNNIDVNNQGFTNEEYEKLKNATKKPKKQRTPEEEKLIQEASEKKKNRQNAISILRGISIRMPLLIYGADIDFDEDFTIDKFLDDEIIDDSSWNEFMPKGVTREIFKKFMKYYDRDILISAGRKIRNTVKSADLLEPTERVKQIAGLFSCFKNPDKETVLTPWRVVNMHMSDCLGGYDFFDENPPVDAIMCDTPHFVDRGKVTEETVANESAQILEINSKTGLYPLYVAYSIYRKRCENVPEEELTLEKKNELWAKTIQENIFVICKTPMAKAITKRTLVGYKDIKVNAHYFDNLINTMQNKQKQFIDRVLKPSYWDRKGEKMKFDAVVGNPPYAEIISSSEKNQSLAKQLFPYFIISSIKLDSKYVSLITPSRWFTGDAQDKSFVKLREFLKENNHIFKLVHFQNENEVFNNVIIKGGVSYFAYNSTYNGNIKFTTVTNGKRNTIERPLFEQGLDIVLSDSAKASILMKVKKKSTKFLTELTKGRNAFGIIGKESVVNNISSAKPFENCCELRLKGNVIRYVSEDKIKKNVDVFNSFKIFVSKSAGAPGKDLKVIGVSYVGKPKTACTDSLIPIGCFDNEIEALNLQKYMSTKFLRFMVSILKMSQNVTQIVYGFVPIQDFTTKSDIDWTKPISEIDKQLYAKYDFTEEEIEFVESMIKPME